MFNWFKKSPKQQMPSPAPTSDSNVVTVITDAGMLALWDRQHFQGINSYEEWEQQLLENANIQRHILDGAFVPLNIEGDGAFGCSVRVGSDADAAQLSARERQYLVVESDPYLFVSQGDACLSGIEYIEETPSNHVQITAVPPGRYAVSIAMIAWEDEPNSRDAKGQPQPWALPDFVVLINPVNDGVTVFCTSITTFERPLPE